MPDESNKPDATPSEVLRQTLVTIVDRVIHQNNTRKGLALFDVWGEALMDIEDIKATFKKAASGEDDMALFLTRAAELRDKWQTPGQP